MAIEQQLEFISEITPFDLLSNQQLESIASSLDVVYFPKDEIIALENESVAKFLFFIIKGRVAEKREEDIVSRYSVRGYFGEAEILGKRKEDQASYFTLEESILYRMPAELFMQAMQENTAFTEFFNASIVDKLNQIHQSIQSATSTEVMMDTVCTAPILPYVAVKQNASLQQAIKAMVGQRTDACLVEYDDDSTGIVTSTDVLKHLAKQDGDRVDSTAAISDLANKPLQTVHEFDYLFNALLKMTRFQIDRLVVRSDQGLIGFLHQKDLMGLFANQSGLVLLKVDQAETVDDLIQIGPQVDALIQTLNRKGIKTHYIAKLVNELHRKMVYKLVEFILPTELADKICLFVMGSEGRSEQVIRTDQDNAIVIGAELSVSESTQLDEFAKQFTDYMVKMGFPPCPGNIMLSNPDWRLPLSEFKSRIADWFHKPSEEHFMNIAILFDAEAIYGNESFLTELKDKVKSKVKEYAQFLRHFAVPVIQFKTPVGFFGGLVTESDSDAVDIKKGGIFPIVHGVRCYALEYGVEQTNTHWRIKALMDKGVFDKEYGIELGETLNFLNTLRLEAMLLQLSEDDSLLPDNKIKISQLSHLQQDVLKQALKVVEEFKKRVTHHFKVNEVL